MKWQGREKSTNVEDYRGRRMSRVQRTGGGLGCLGIIAIILFTIFSGDSSFLVNPPEQPIETTQPIQRQYQAEKRGDQALSEFVSVVLNDTEDVWKNVFNSQLGSQYVDPKLVLYDDYIQSGCGVASSATGPFYCPADQRLYVDLSFFNELKNRFGAGGDFAIAYVIAHEVGHHVQTLMGITQQVAQQRKKLSPYQYNALSVRMELQADFLAGVWAHHAQKMKDILEEGDIAEAMRAAAAVGDDNIQSQTQGYVRPESFTHGSAEQRVRWFMKGLKSGNIQDGDTFSADPL